ncbi:MAG TPA: hypothetical protein VHX12_14675, partial [Acidisoma sp.]|nr:hypothetical protein [Acidisoma sp.]
PLSAKPFPYRITAEMPERQQVHLDLLHIATGQPIAAAPPVVLRETVMPPLGLGVSPDTPTAGLGEAIRRLAPAFTALEIDLLRDPRLAEARLLLAAIPGALRLDIRKASPEAVLGAVQTLEPLLGGREVIGVSLWDADEALVAAARALLRGLRIGSGTGAFFTELNRGTDWPAGADYLSWTSNPTVHGSSDDTLGESVEPLDDILRTAKAKWPGRRFQLGPHTLGMRFNPNATTAEGRSRTASPDPRQGQSIAAAWMLGMFAGYADDAVETISFFEAEGPRGLVGSDGGMTAAGDLFTKLAAPRGAPVAVLTWAGQPRLRGLRVDGRAGRSYCIANLHHETTELLLPDGGHHRLGGFDTLWLGAS